MRFGPRPPKLSIILLCLLPLTGWCNDAEVGTGVENGVDALLARLARPAPSSVAFTEIRFSNLLATPLIVSGDMGYSADGRLSRRVERPYREQVDIGRDRVEITREDQRPRRFSLKRAPELAALLATFRALLTGDRAGLDPSFATTLTETATHWQLVLTPRASSRNERLQDIVLSGHFDTPKCIWMTETSGNASVILLGVETLVGSDLPALPTTGDLQQYCQISTT